jgi:hypothetical protein
MRGQRAKVSTPTQSVQRRGAHCFASSGKTCHPMKYIRRIGPHEAKPRLDALSGNAEGIKRHLSRSESIAKPRSRIAHMLDRVPCGGYEDIKISGVPVQVPRFIARHDIKCNYEMDGRRVIPGL